MSFMKPVCIDFHTHKICQDDSDRVCIHNLFAHNVRSFDDWNLYRNTFFSIGLHPWHHGTEQENEAGMAEILKAASCKKVLAIGECGLDKFCDLPLKEQRYLFTKQIEISETVSKPVIVHCVKAYDEILHLRKQINPQQPWIIHGFNSSEQMAGQLMDHGCWPSFGHRIFSQNSKASAALQQIPLTGFLLETDDEDLQIDAIYEKVALLKEISLSDLQKQMENNFAKLFGERS